MPQATGIDARPGGAADEKVRERRAAAKKARQRALQPGKFRLSANALEKVAREELRDFDCWANCDGFRYDAKRAHAACKFFPEKLRFVKGRLRGEPFNLQRWQMAIVANLFGWVDDEGRRRFREAFIYVPRKAGKSTLVAGILMYMLFEDGEPGAELYGAASDRNQAGLIFQICRGMVDQSEELTARSRIYKTTKQIELEEDLSFYRVISADASSAHGGNTHCAVIDELHTQPDRELTDVLQTSMGSRDNPLFISITTADYDRPSACNEKLAYARKVRDGDVLDKTFLPVIYETAVDAKWDDPEVWRAANPNYDISVGESFYEAECQKAKALPSFENVFKRLYLNCVTQQEDRWIPLDAWDDCPPLLPEHMTGPCWCGLDLASTIDITAAVVTFDCGDGTLAIVPRFWVPGASAEKRVRRDKVDYIGWANEGHLKLTDGNVMDYDVVRADVREMAETYGFDTVVIDRWNATQVSVDLERDGLKPIMCAQTFASLSGATKHFEKMVLGRKIRHGGNPILRWMLAHCAVSMDTQGNLKPDRKKSTEKIDGIAATIMSMIPLDVGAPESIGVWTV